MSEQTLAQDIKRYVSNELMGTLDNMGGDNKEAEAAIRQCVKDTARLLSAEIDPDMLAGIEQVVVDDFLHYGPLQPLLADQSITEIMVNGTGLDEAGAYKPPATFIERGGHITFAPEIQFDSAAHLERIINKIAEDAGVRCDSLRATGCAMLPNGKARAAFTLPPIASDGASLTLRKFKDDMMTLDDLVDCDSLTPDMAAFLTSAIAARCSIIISGGTGAGKTTVLNALSGKIPNTERIITIEDAPELRLQIPHVVRWQTREENTEGGGELTQRALVKHALRNRPDRIIVGECRGREAYDMLQAMQTDHPGSMTTIHANNPDSALKRLCSLVREADTALDTFTIKEQISDALGGGLVIQAHRCYDGRRRIASIAAVYALTPDAPNFQKEILFEYRDHKVEGGRWIKCGIQPRLIKEKIIAAGYTYEPAWFIGED